MKERPILFSAPMVRALLAGTKTQTRRAVNMKRWTLADGGTDFAPPISACPYGQPGDRLWVRETWGVGSRPDQRGGYDGIEYRADMAWLEDGDDLHCHKVTTPDDICLGDYKSGWRPSIHMFRWASRILLEITEVRVQRLQDISDDDAIAEGIENDPRLDPAGTCKWRHYGQAHTGISSPVSSYGTLWDSINGAGSWDADPWVWAVSFKQIPSLRIGTNV